MTISGMVRRWSGCLQLLSCIALAAGCAPDSPATHQSSLPAFVNFTKGEPAQQYSYEVVQVYPHDPTAFTQGLLYHDGWLYESTGLAGRSSLRQVRAGTGKVERSVALPDDAFGEGLALMEGRLIQLTWKSGVAYVYQLDSLEPMQELRYGGEGWGLTTDGRQLIMSDGSARLYFRAPDSFAVQYYVTVTDDSVPVAGLNELEYINGLVYANVWRTDRIALIDPADGTVVAWLDLSGLLNSKEVTAGADVLNGIAHDETNDRLFVTGKLWPWLFEIRLVAVR